jgi:hypothetical protein
METNIRMRRLVVTELCHKPGPPTKRLSAFAHPISDKSFEDSGEPLKIGQTPVTAFGLVVAKKCVMAMDS